MLFHCVISNFEKKNVLLITKDFLSKLFQLQVFSQKSELCKKWNLKTIQSH